MAHLAASSAGGIIVGALPHPGPRQGCPLCPPAPRLVVLEPGGPVLLVAPPAVALRGEVDELGGDATSRRA